MENAIVVPQSTYINPYTDFGFKKLFGEEASKDLLIDFLNQLLPQEYQVVDLEFRNPEVPPEIPIYRKAIFDIHCENEKKDKFVVEMQKSRLEYFKDRVIFYMTFPIRNQAPKGGMLKIVKDKEKKVDWNFQLQPVYFVGVLDFDFAPAEARSDEYVVEVEYKDQKNKVFYDKLKYFFVVMPRFNKTESELNTHKDKWIYFLKNLSSFDAIPTILNEPIFQRGFEVAKVSNYNAEQLAAYEQSYNDYLSFKSSLDYSFQEGIEKGEKIGIEKGEKIGIEKGEIIGIEKGEIIGIEKGKGERNNEIAIEMIKDGESNEKIKRYTGLTDEQINELRKQLDNQ